MRRERFERMDAASRDRLLAVALREFAARGFERASLNAIIAEAGLSKGSYYHYFDDKRDLLFETLSRAFEGLKERAPLPEIPRTKATYWSSFEDHNRRLVAAIADQPLVLKVLSSLHRAHFADPHFEPIREKMRATYVPALEAGQRLGCVRRDLPLATLLSIWEAADAAFDSSVIDEPIDRKRLTAHAILAFDLFRRLFEAKERTPARRTARSTRPRRAR